MQPRRVESRRAMPHNSLTRQASSEAKRVLCAFYARKKNFFAHKHFASKVAVLVLFFYHRGHRGTEENICFVSVLCLQEKLFRS